MRKTTRKGESVLNMVGVGAIGLFLMYALVSGGIASGLSDAKTVDQGSTVEADLTTTADFESAVVGPASDNYTVTSDTVRIASGNTTATYLAGPHESWPSATGNNASRITVNASLPADTSVTAIVKEADPVNNTPETVATQVLSDGQTTIDLDESSSYLVQFDMTRDTTGTSSPAVDVVQASSVQTTTSEYAGLYDLLFIIFVIVVIGTIAKYGGVL